MAADTFPGWWRARAGLIWTLARTDFKVRYHGTAGGFVWALAKPATMFVLLMSVFSYLFAGDPHYKSNLIVGLFLWDVFAEGTKAGLLSLHARGFLVSKARCPPWILVVTSISNALLTLVVFAAAILLFLSWQGAAPSLTGAVWFLAYCAALVVLVVAFSLAASVLFLRYRDLHQVWDMAVQAGFFVAPVIYPIGILPERVHVLLYAWPPTPIIEFARAVLVQQQTPSPRAHAWLAGMIAVAAVTAIAIYRRLAPRSAEYL